MGRLPFNNVNAFKLDPKSSWASIKLVLHGASKDCSGLRAYEISNGVTKVK